MLWEFWKGINKGFRTLQTLPYEHTAHIGIPSQMLEPVKSEFYAQFIGACVHVDLCRAFEHITKRLHTTVRKGPIPYKDIVLVIPVCETPGYMTGAVFFNKENHAYIGWTRGAGPKTVYASMIPDKTKHTHTYECLSDLLRQGSWGSDRATILSKPVWTPDEEFPVPTTRKYGKGCTWLPKFKG